MKKVLLALTLLSGAVLFSQDVLGAPEVIRDKYGNRIGTAETDSRGKTTYRDRYGNRTGTAETDSRGKTTYRDKHGNRKGTRGR